MHHNKYYANIGEKIAIKFLLNKGYKLLYTNFRIHNDEIDIICQHNKQLVFIEVKTRLTNNFGTAEDQLTNKKIHNLKRAMHNYELTLSIIDLEIKAEFIAISLNINKKMANIKHFLDIL